MAEDKRILTCVYCGMEYPQDTPAWGSSVLTDHIMVCEKHPLRDAEEKIRKLTGALVGLVGASEPDSLKAIECQIRLAPAPDSDKAAMINAIHVLLLVA